MMIEVTTTNVRLKNVFIINILSDVINNFPAKGLGADTMTKYALKNFTLALTLNYSTERKVKLTYF